MWTNLVTVTATATLVAHTPVAPAFRILPLIEIGTMAGYATAVILRQGIQDPGSMFGPPAACIARMIPTRVRCTGSSIAYQASAALGDAPSGQHTAGIGGIAGAISLGCECLEISNAHHGNPMGHAHQGRQDKHCDPHGQRRGSSQGN